MSSKVESKVELKETVLGIDAGSDLLKLVSKDKKEFTVDRNCAMISALVKTSLDTDTSATEVPVPGVDSKCMAEIVAYMKHHNGVDPDIIEKPLRSKVLKDICKDKWDADFIDRIGEDRQHLYDMILAANYMDIRSLLHLGCAKVASLLKGQPLEQIKEILSKGLPPKEDEAKEAKESKEEVKA